MSFVEGFYSFNLEIAKASDNVYASTRVKTPRHCSEPLKNLFARVLAFMHAYEDGIQLSAGLLSPHEPALFIKNSLNEITAWIEVGNLDEKKVKKALAQAKRQQTKCRFGAYFYDEAELKDSLAKWNPKLRAELSNIFKIFMIDHTGIDSILSLEKKAMNWSATIIDETMFLDIDGTSLEMGISEITMADILTIESDDMLAASGV